MKNLDRTGIILYTIAYEACVVFYRDVLELEIMFSTEMLTCFSFGGAYLMVELDDTYDSSIESEQHVRTRSCLRMNTSNVKTMKDRLIAHGIKVDYQEHSWGTIAKFHDPDGNLCAFKDSQKFEAQVAGKKLT